MSQYTTKFHRDLHKHRMDLYIQRIDMCADGVFTTESLTDIFQVFFTIPD